MRNKVVGSFLHSGVNTPPLYPLLFTPSAGNKRLRMFVIIKPLKCRKSILEDALKVSQFKCSIDFRCQFFPLLVRCCDSWLTFCLQSPMATGPPPWLPIHLSGLMSHQPLGSRCGSLIYRRPLWLSRAVVTRCVVCVCCVSWSITCWIFKSHQNISAI